MTEVGKMSIWALLAYFVAYIVLHYLIIKLYEGKKLSLQNNSNNEKLQKEVKYMMFAKTWFPAIYVIILIIVLAI